MEIDIKKRMHSGEHVFMKSLILQSPDVKVEKVELGEKESKVFILADGLDWETVFKAEELANKIIKEGREINIKNISKKKAAEIQDLRVRFDRIKSDDVRIVEVKDFDLSTCTGDHCTNTSQIGGFLVNGFNSLGNRRYEIRFMVDIKDELFEHSKMFRNISFILNTEKDKAVGAVEKLKKKNEENKEKIRVLQKDQPLDVSNEKINDINFVYGMFDDYERLIIMRKVNELVRDKTVVCILNTTDKGTYVIISASEDSGYSANKLLQKVIKEFNGKGGGKEKFASGFVDNNYRDKVIPKLKELLR